MILSCRPLGKTERREIEAQIVRAGAGPSVILLEDGSVLDLFEWRSQGYRIIKANRQETDFLIRMGLTV